MKEGAMQTGLWLLTSWQNLVTRSFIEHTLAAAVITIAAVGILILLQHEYRRGQLLTNAGFVLLGWIVAITVIPLAMIAAAKGWAMLGAAAPIVSTISEYLYGIYERHPLLVLVIVGIATTSYFLKQSWPYRISWGPVRAVCTVLGIVLLVHVAGPIADLVDADPAAAPKKLAAPKLPAKEAVAQAIKSGDLRYVSVPLCTEEVSGVVLPLTKGVKKLGPSCDEALGSEGVALVRAYRDYAAEYNKSMQEHNRAAEPKPAEPAPTAENKVVENKAQSK
jgi:hypothetical protein